MANKSEQLLKLVVEAAENKKAHQMSALDLQGISLIADYFVICTGNSDIQVQSIAGEIRKQVEKEGFRIRGIEGVDSARWVLIDIGDVVVHIFHRDERDYYQIERLWSDAKVVELA